MKKNRPEDRVKNRPVDNVYDLAIIGGGINGAGIARDAAGRGLKVLLCEQNDLGSATSSASSKLIHGGLRYLEHYEFRLVRKALQERETLMKIAPHIIVPLEFMMPSTELTRPSWLIRIGLFLYDHLAKRKQLPNSRSINFHKDTSNLAENPLKEEIKKGFSYFDCFTDDSRLVILNALSAKSYGAEILTRTKCIHAIPTQSSSSPSKPHWEVTLLDKINNEEKKVQAKVLINASGPWLNEMQNVINTQSPAPSKTKKNANKTSKTTNKKIKLIKGSHIVIPPLYPGKQAYTLQHSDKRVIFVIPFKNDYTLIGTTDLEYQGDPKDVAISIDEKNYLCDAVNHYFKKQISPEEIIWDYAGVRPLQSEDDETPSTLSRDYKLELLNADEANSPPLLNIIGGKITTYRKLAEHVMRLLKPIFPHISSDWTDSVPLPGGDFENGDLSRFKKKVFTEYPWLPHKLAERYAEQYGTRIHQLLDNCRTLSDLGIDFGHSLYEKEIAYLKENEWACTLDDILWRRTKLGLLKNSSELTE